MKAWHGNNAVLPAWSQNAAGQPAGQTAGQTAGEIAPSNQRYRSFAERYIIERIRNMPNTDNPLEQGHKLATEARAVYKMIRNVGTTLEPND